MASILERNKNVKAPKKTREEYAEDALYREVWEEVNNDKTQAFIKKYYRYILAAALGILIVATAVRIGINAYNAHKVAVATNYETAIANLDGNALAALAGNTSGAMSDLALFQSYILTNDVNKLEELAANGDTRDFRDLAKMHIASIRGDDMSGADLEKYLDDMNTKKSPFYYSSRLAIAQKYLSDGDRENANKWLDIIINDSDAPESISAAAQMLK